MRASIHGGPNCKTKTYPTTCPDCQDSVFFFSCTCGSKVFFDTLAPDWNEHACWDLDILIKTEHNYEELIQLGMSALRQGKFDHSIGYFSKAVAIMPQSPESWMHLAGVVKSETEQLFCLLKAQALNLNSAAIRISINRLESKSVVPETPRVLTLFLWNNKTAEAVETINVEINQAKEKKDYSFKCKACRLSFSTKKQLRKHKFQSHFKK